MCRLWKLAVLAIACILLVDGNVELPDGVSEEGYCVACETMAAHIHKRLSSSPTSDNDGLVEDILKNMCSTGYFNHVVEFQPRDMVKACKHLLKGHRKHITSSLETVLSSKGTLPELNSAMCHMSSPACRTVRKPAQKNHSITDEETMDAIEAFIAAHDGEVKMPRPSRKDEL